MGRVGRSNRVSLDEKESEREEKINYVHKVNKYKSCWTKNKLTAK